MPRLIVFILKKDHNRRTPRAHRLAIKTIPNFTGRCNPLLHEKYYIHAYQAGFLVGDLETIAGSLNSRAMAYNVSNMFPTYIILERKTHLTLNTTSRQDDLLPDEPIRPTNHATIPPTGMPTPFVPLANLPHQYPRPGIGPYGLPYLQLPMTMNNYTQPTLCLQYVSNRLLTHTVPHLHTPS